MARDEFDKKTKETLAKRVGFQCSNPDCPNHATIGPGLAEDATINLGEAAHICAASPGGPRYDPAMTVKQRTGIANGIWLCQRCAGLIDRDERQYTRELLENWKQQAEQRAHQRLTGAAQAVDSPSFAIAEIEAVVRRYCEDRVIEWNEARNDPEDPDRLEHYVEPHYSVLKQGAQPIDASNLSVPGDDGRQREDPYVPVWEQRSESYEPVEELRALLGVSRRLWLTEDAGAGKSVASRRIQAFLCGPEGQRWKFDGQPRLVVRWEPRVQRWPDSYDRQGLIRALAVAVEPSVRALGARVTPAAVAEWALDHHRVFWILDALDQVTDESAVPSLEESLQSGPLQGAELLLTSRANAFNKHAGLSQRVRGWRFARIDGFDRRQQQQYLNDLPGGGLDALFPNYAEVEQLLRIPVVLGLVRRLVEGRGLVRFRTRAELYLQVNECLMSRAAEKLYLHADSEQQVRWSEILAATACEMMVRGMYGYSVQGSFAVHDVRRGASQRCGQPITADEWRIIESVSDLTDRCILDGLTGNNLCWKHRGMMEFYCGLHLARNSQQGWIASVSDRGGVESVRCGDAGVRRMAAEPDWDWAWRFAIEMPPVVWQSDSDVLRASLAELFERPERLDPSKPRARPNELIYRAWPLLDGSRADGVRISRGLAVLERFQAEFRELVEANDTTAIELRNGFVRCPPAERGIDCQPFRMGSREEEAHADSDERPQHSVVVPPFHFQTTPVTRAQYRLYDAQHESVVGRGWRFSDVFVEYAPEDACPLILVSWYDAWVFAHWAGGRLPSEAEWEYACRAGTQTAYGFDEGKALGEYAWFDKNSQGRTHPVGRKLPNAWGLFDMHGNVWEWCEDFWHGDYDGAPRDGSAWVDQAAGSRRVYRGGSWAALALFCRCACRLRGAPDGRRFGRLGFRFVLASSFSEGIRAFP